MFNYKKIDLGKLYEQKEEVAADGKPLVYDTSNEKESDVPIEKNGKLKMNRLYAFPIDETTAAELNKFADTKEGEWKSDTPIKLIKDGPTGPNATLNGDAVYFMIKISDSKEKRKNIESLQLKINDRVYVAWVTTGRELKKQLNTATNFANRVRISVVTPIKVPQSLEFWKESKTQQAQTENTMPAGETEANVSIDIDQQMRAPGTAEGMLIK